MFRELLANAASGLPGCRGAALVGLDGVLIDQWIAPGSGDGFSMEPAAAEVTTVIRAARGALVSSQGGGLSEMTLRTGGWTGVARALAGPYFLILLTAPDSPVGRTRFAASRAAPLLERELA